MDDDRDRELRAARRGATYSGQVIRLGEEKPALYEGKTPLQRLALQTSLVRRMAALSGLCARPVPRAEWPGEIFNIDERNRRTR